MNKDSEKYQILSDHIDMIENKMGNDYHSQNTHSLFSDEDVLEKILKPSKNNGYSLNNLFILAFSLIVFAGTGLFRWQPLELGILILVLAIHELGHFIAMKFFKYRDVKMFFLPFLGAAVSGKKGTPSETQKALVSLSGPLPGIIIGLALAIIYGITKERIYFQASNLFIFINAFNLLPLYPLDGGRFFESVLFSRNLIIEIIFKIITSILLLIFAISIQAWFLILIPITILISLGTSHKASKISNKIRKNISEEEINNFSLNLEMIKLIRSKMPQEIETQYQNIKHFCVLIENIWNRIYSIRPRIIKTILLISLYFIGIIFTGASAITLFTIEEFKKYRYEIVQEYNDDSLLVSIEKSYRDSSLHSVNHIDSLGRYHGISLNYNIQTGKLEKKGEWFKGKWHGEWEIYDSNSVLTKITTFDNGKFISEKVLRNEIWKEYLIDDLPKMTRSTYQMHEDSKPSYSKTWLELNSHNN